MVTVLNFFATYFWSFLGYAIAFHILLPSNGPFSNFGDAFIKVINLIDFIVMLGFMQPLSYTGVDNANGRV